METLLDSTSAYSHETLQGALVAGFSLDDIKDLCFHLDKVDFEQISGDTLDAKSRQLILFMEKRNRLSELIKEVEQSRPGLLANTATLNSTLAVNSEPAKEAAQKIEDGLQALKESLQAPEVHRAILFFQADFILAQKQIDRLHHLKQLQDRFHELQPQYSLLVEKYEKVRNATAATHGYWGKLVADVRGVSGDDAASKSEQDNREALTSEMTHTISKLDEVLDARIKSGNVSGDTLWADKLDEARKDLRESLTEFDQQKMDDAIEWIAYVLNHEPDRINDWIVGAVEVLLESQMTLRMIAVHEKLKEIKAGDRVIEPFGELVIHLPQLTIELKSLVAGHYGWQAIYLEIDHILSDREANINELSQEWRALTMTIQRLIGQGNAEPWVAEFNATASEIDRAFVAQAVEDAKRKLRFYQGQAYTRFRKVEEGLVRICDKLRGIGIQLSGLLKELAQPND